MPTQCFTPLFGRRIRVTALDECGNVPAAATPCSVVVTSGFVTVSRTSETEDGVEITPRRADGTICFSERAENSFKRFTLEITFCGVNPDLLAMVTNAEPYTDAQDDVAGFTIPEGELGKRFALELWMGLAGGACGAGETSAGAYLLLPYVSSGVIGDLEVGGESEITFSMTGAFTRGGNVWGVGPYDVLVDDTPTPGTPSPLPTALDPLDHLLLVKTGVAPPPEACDCAAMPA
jgi:hypothetical protein